MIKLILLFINIVIFNMIKKYLCSDIRFIRPKNEHTYLKIIMTNNIKNNILSICFDILKA